jgi:hypothetical protein
MEQEIQEAFETAINSLKYDYMFMGKCSEYLYFKHAETRMTIKIPTNQSTNRRPINVPSQRFIDNQTV